MTKTTVRHLDQKCVVRGHATSGRYNGDDANPHWLAPGDPPVLSEELGTMYLRVSNSEVTPGWGAGKTSYVRIPKRRKPFLTKPPVQPVYRPPKRPPPFQRRIGVSESSTQRAIRKYNARLASWEQRKWAYDATYNNAHLRYVHRLALYEAKKKRFVDRPLGTIRKAVGVKPTFHNNPYSKTTVTDSQWQYGYLVRKTTDREEIKIPGRPSEFRFLNRPGDEVMYEEAVYGISSGNVFARTPALPNALPPQWLIHDATQKCVNQLYEQVGAAQVHVGNMIAERAQTVDMLVSLSKRLKDFLHSPKKTVFKYLEQNLVRGSKKLYRKVADDFIMYCFGVEPLAKDIYSQAKRLVELSNEQGNDDLVRVRAGGSTEDSTSVTIDEGTYLTTYETKTHVRVRYALQYRVDYPVARYLSQYGLTDPSQIAWEMMPWSFVVDWFYPVGELLASTTADQGLSFSSGTMSTEITTTCSVRRVFKNHPPMAALGWQYTGSISRTQTIKTKTRTVLSGPPLPMLPRLKNPFSVRHVALTMALWRQRS